MPGNVRRIFLVRHGLSASNVDKKLHHEIPDHAIPLHEEGKKQAEAAGIFLRNYLDPLGDIRPRMWVSPYKRTRQTADGIETQLGTFAVPEDHPAAFGPVSDWGTREATRLRDRKENIVLCEQQFGLFDGWDDDELKKVYPQEQAHYQKCEDFEGRFWARMPLGESRFDVAVRVHQIFGTWHRDADRYDVRDIIVVSHGVTIRSIVMRWLHLPFEWFEEEKNPQNCSIRLIEDGEDKGYIFEGFPKPQL